MAMAGSCDGGGDGGGAPLPEVPADVLLLEGNAMQPGGYLGLKFFVEGVIGPGCCAREPQIMRLRTPTHARRPGRLCLAPHPAPESQNTKP